MSAHSLTRELREAATRRLRLAASLIALAVPLSGCGTGALWDKFMAKDETVVGYFIWLLFRFDGRLNRITYRYCRIVAKLKKMAQSVTPRFRGRVGCLRGLLARADTLRLPTAP